MATPNPKIQNFMDTFKVDADEIWEIKSGRGAWAVKHSALERVAAEVGITFDVPQFAEKDGLQKNVALMVVGHLGNRSEWSIGEASPLNYKTTSNMPAYPYAMAEKRAKDRVILKLLNTHGAVYSEDEADDFKRQNPHVTRPEDLVPDVEYDAQGHPVDNIPHGDESIERLPKAKVRFDYESAEREMLAIKTPDALMKWGATNANRISTYPSDWQAIMRGRFSEHLNELRQGKAA